MEKLVANLHQFPCIWDCRIPDYSDRHKKKVAFEKLAELCGFSMKDCTTKYSTIRTNFRRDYNAIVEIPASGSAAQPPPKKLCIYYEELQFLIPTLRKRRTKFNYCNDVPAIGSVKEDTNTQPSTSTMSAISPPASCPSISSQKTNTSQNTSLAWKGKKRKRRPVEPSFGNDTLENCVKQEVAALSNPRPASPQDDVSGFCKMIQHDLSQIPHNRRKRVMHKISGLIMDEIEGIPTTSQPPPPPPPPMLVAASVETSNSARLGSRVIIHGLCGSRVELSSL